MKLLTLTLALVLTACGADEQMTDSQKENAILVPETAEGIPDFRSWQIMPGATDKCFQADSDKVHCLTEFTAGDRNCATATFKFVAVKKGYMYVQTLENIFIRQGEFHSIEFTGEPEIFNITDEFADQEYHVFQCIGQDGEVVKI